MVTRIGGQRRKTRHMLKKQYRQRGKVSHRRFLQRLEPGQKAVLEAESAVQKGMYFRRFHGKVATVVKRVGGCYELSLKDGNKEKRVIVHPVHLKVVA